MSDEREEKVIETDEGLEACAQECQPESAVEHQVGIGVVKMPTRVFTGTAVDLVVRVACDQGCNLEGDVLRIYDPAGDVVIEEGLVWDADAGEARLPVTLTMPEESGEYEWTLEYEPAGACGEQAEGAAEDGEAAEPACVHQRVSVTLTLNAQPHRASLAIWGVASPSVVGDKVRVSVGVTCGAGCNLCGSVAEVRDKDSDELIATVELSEPGGSAGTMWTGTAEVEVPERSGLHTWVASIKDMCSPIDHGTPSPRSMSFAVVAERPTCTLVVNLNDDRSCERSFEHANVVARVPGKPPYRGQTDAEGVCTLKVPAGTYEVHASLMEHRDGSAEGVVVTEEQPGRVTVFLRYDPTC